MTKTKVVTGASKGEVWVPPYGCGADIAVRRTPPAGRTYHRRWYICAHRVNSVIRKAPSPPP